MSKQVKYWTILYRGEADTVAMRLTPSGGLTRLKIYAAMIDDKDYAEQVAQELRQTYPKATVKVAPF